MWTCNHCKEQFWRLSPPNRRSHSKWCIANPRATEIRQGAKKYAKVASAAAAARQRSDGERAAASERLRMRHLSGEMKGYVKKHTPDSIEKIRIAAFNSKHRRLIKSTRTYTMKCGEQVLLDSSWEEALAKRLDQLNIDWVRPKDPLTWTDREGRQRHYFPDFFLPKHKIFIDPKNPAAMKSQSEKIEWLSRNRVDVIILKSLNECIYFSP